MANLIAHYRLDEVSGTIAADSSDNNYNGTLNGLDSDDWTTGDINGAIEFDTTEQYVAIPSAVLQGVGDFSISFRLKASDSTNWRRIFSGTHAAMDAVIDIIALPTSNVRLTYRGQSKDFTTADLGVTIRDGSWHTLTITFDSSTNTATFYINGSVTVSKVIAGDTGQTIDVDEDFHLGNTANNPSANGSWNGHFDDVAIYTGILTATEVASIHRLGVARPLSRVAVIGDIQSMDAAEKTALKDYFVANWQADCLAAAVFVGDMVNVATTAQQWADTKSAVDGMIAAGLPTLFTLGNHDVDDVLDTVRDVDLAVAGLSPGIMSVQDSFQASAGLSESDLYCQSHLITMHDRTDLWITMPWAPTPDQWAFAQAQAALHPNKSVHLLHHAWLDDSGVLWHSSLGNDPEQVSPNYTIPAANPRKPPGISGNGQWEDYGQDIKNLAFTAAGHSITTPNTAQLVAYGNNGNVILNTFVNDQDAANGGDGFTQFIERDGNEWRGRSVKTVTDVVQSSDSFFLTLEDSLKGHYKFDETSGTVASDSSGKSNDGILVGGFEDPDDWITGKVGGALQFDNDENQQVEIPLEVLDGAEDFTIAGWFLTSDSLDFVRAWSGTHALSANELVLAYTPGGGINFQYKGVQVSWSSATIVTNIRDGGWHHIAITLEAATATAKLYVNGELVGGLVVTGQEGLFLSFDEDLHIGNYAEDPTAARSWYGAIDDVRIYRHQLSSGAIKSLSSIRRGVSRTKLSVSLSL